MCANRVAQQESIEALAQQLRALPKYRHLNLPLETIISLLEGELPKYRNRKDAVKAARQKLHQIVALYLEEMDYAAFSARLEQAVQHGSEEELKTVCRDILAAHASTRERLPFMSEFYQAIFDVIGKPRCILDLACGLQPFALPWMGLPQDTSYYAYDLNRPRVDLINQFFEAVKRPCQAVHEDILLNPPQTAADAAFFFKEAHRFEQRSHGCNRDFWMALRVRYLLISLPTSSLSGKHDLLEQQRRLVYSNLEGLTWKTQELLFENEVVFCVEKDDKA